MSQSFTYKNCRDKVFHLYPKVSSKGKISYYFSSKLKEGPLNEIPESYEVWEHPESAQPFLRKIVPCLINAEEGALVKEAMNRLCSHTHKIDIWGDQITIYIGRENATNSFDFLKTLLPSLSHQDFQEIRNNFKGFIRCHPMLRLTLEDKKNRLFSVERWCFYSDIDDWYELCDFDYGKLENLCEELIPHLGKESYYELM